MRRRFVPFVEQLIRTNVDRNLLLIGHGGLYHCMLPLALAGIDHRFAMAHRLDHTTVVMAELRSDRLVCTSWGEIKVST